MEPMPAPTDTTPAPPPTSPAPGSPRRRLGWSIVALVCAAVCVAILAVSAVVGMSLLRAYHTPKLSWLGNTDDVRDQVRRRAGGEAFRFAVLGDVKKGTGTFARVMAEAAKTKPDFVILTGDQASEPRYLRHGLFVRALAEADPGAPVLFAPGNHDIRTGAEVSVAEFEAMYGPCQFDLLLGRNLFVFLNDNLTYSQPKAWSYLAEVLRKRKGQADRLFVTMHVPPRLPGVPVRHTLGPGDKAFHKVLARFPGPRWVFCGHYHGYVRHEDGLTTTIITAGAGAPLYGPVGTFHNLVTVEVDGETVRDGVIRVEPDPSPWPHRWHNVLVEADFAYGRDWRWTALGVVAHVVVLAALVFWIRLYRRCRAPRA